MGLEAYWLKCLSHNKNPSRSKKNNFIPDYTDLLEDTNWKRNPVEELSGRERTLLKQRAHHLKPIVHIGQNGITEQIIKEIRRQLFIHELIKIKWSSLSKEDGNKKEQAKELAKRVGAHFIKLIGQNVILYNKRP